MKDELQGKLVEILTSIQNAAGKAGDFAMGQLPDIAQSYILYGRVISLVGVVLSLALIGLGVYVFLGVRAHLMKRGDFLGSEPLVVVPGGIFAIVAGLVGAANLSTSASAAALVWFAPKVWLLKEMASLIK